MSDRDAKVTATADDYVVGLLERIKRDERERVLEGLRDRLDAAKAIRDAGSAESWREIHPGIRHYIAGYIDGLATAIEAAE